MEQYFNLEYLREVSEGDDAFCHSMISYFVENTPSVLDNLSAKIRSQEWLEVRQIAHKLKPQLIYMGISCIQDEVELIEQFSRTSTNLEQIPIMADKSIKYCLIAIEQLKEELKKFEL